ncbi:hypothetical protein [Streptomyces sp. NPDC046371]|uniref:hypothetical protein n=1 Tax=Streptomyces sp. NPDC046371 TaxID=3154916 RepID=UPI0033FC8D95
MPPRRGPAVRLGLHHQPACVLALAVLGDDVAPDLLATGRRTAEALALHLSAVHPRAATAYLGDLTYAVLPGSTVETATRVADAFLSRVGSRVPAVIGIGRLAADPSDLPRSRAEGDRALRVLTATGTPHRAAALKDIYLPSLLLGLADQVHIDAHPSDCPVTRPRAYDAEHHSALTETLARFLRGPRPRTGFPGLRGLRGRRGQWSSAYCWRASAAAPGGGCCRRTRRGRSPRCAVC